MAKKKTEVHPTKTALSSELQLSLINSCCAAIDVGSTMMMISYSDRDGHRHLLEVAAFTEDLCQAVETLKKAGVTTVAMEATGIYWIVIYELLEQAGFQLCLVNAKHFKNVDGQKTDVRDAQWLHQLHAHGLLRRSHIAPEVFRDLKSYLHEREIVQQQKGDTLNRIQKTLTQMNIKVQHLLSDIEGVSGMLLLRGIADGISDPAALLALVDTRKLKASEEELLKSLHGIYREQYIFILNQQLKSYDFFRQQMKVYESCIEGVLKQLMPLTEDGSSIAVASKKGLVRKNQYGINLRGYLSHIAGVDLTQIPGLDEISLLNIIAVTGLDMSKWKTAGHFTSWLGLSPDPKISGGKVIGHKRKFTANKATQAFRLGAQSMWQEKGSLGATYRRLSARKGSKKANKALARRLAVIFYNLMLKKESYDAKRMETDVAKQEARKVARLKKEAARYGYTLKEAA